MFDVKTAGMSGTTAAELVGQEVERQNRGHFDLDRDFDLLVSASSPGMTVGEMVTAAALIHREITRRLRAGETP